VLLCEIHPEGKGDLDPSRLNPHEFGADRSHERLAGETVPDSAIESRILGLKSGRTQGNGFGAGILHCQRLPQLLGSRHFGSALVSPSALNRTFRLAKLGINPIASQVFT